MIKNLLNIFIIIFICLSVKAMVSYDQTSEKFYIRWPQWMINDDFSELSVEDLKSKNSNQICKEMVNRRSLKISKENSQSYDFMNNSVILLNFPSYLMKKIAANGFLNQHQTSTGLGFKGKEIIRDILEQGLYKTRFPNLFNLENSLVKKINEVRPKSSFIQFNDVKNALIESATYGDIFAVFTSNDIKERTIFAERDSLGLLGDMQDDIDSVKVTPLIAKGLAKPDDANLYREALICGEVTIKQADYFLVGCKLPTYFSGSSDDLDDYEKDLNHKKDFLNALDYLLDKNYKIFTCKINNQIEGYEKGVEITKENLYNNIFLLNYLKNIGDKKTDIEMQNNNFLIFND